MLRASYTEYKNKIMYLEIHTKDATNNRNLSSLQNWSYLPLLKNSTEKKRSHEPHIFLVYINYLMHQLSKNTCFMKT